MTRSEAGLSASSWVAGQSGERTGRGVKTVYTATLGAKPEYAIGILRNGEHMIVVQTCRVIGVVAIDLELVAVEAVQPVFGANPQESPAVGKNHLADALRKSLVESVVVETEVGRESMVFRRQDRWRPGFLTYRPRVHVLLRGNQEKTQHHQGCPHRAKNLRERLAELLTAASLPVHRRSEVVERVAATGVASFSISQESSLDNANRERGAFWFEELTGTLTNRTMIVSWTTRSRQSHVGLPRSAFVFRKGTIHGCSYP